jgi:hypothetical protein
MFSPFDISCDRPNWNWILWDKITAHMSREWQLLFVRTSFLPSPCSYCFLTDFHVKDCRMNNVIFFFIWKVAYDSILCGFYLQLNCIIISWSFAPTILLISLTKNLNSFILSWSLSVQVSWPNENSCLFDVKWNSIASHVRESTRLWANWLTWAEPFILLVPIHDVSWIDI